MSLVDRNKDNKFQKAGYYMTNFVSSNRPEKYNIAAFFLGVGELS